MIAMVNELYVGDSGIDLMKMVVELRPKYDNSIVALLTLMQRKGLKLTESSEAPCELVLDFNSEMSTDEFREKLKQTRKEAPKSIVLLQKRIKAKE